jgi:hypothetical protein
MIQNKIIGRLMAAVLLSVCLTDGAGAQEHGHPRMYGPRGVFLRPTVFRQVPGADQEVRLVNGAYSKSDKPTAREQMQGAGPSIDRWRDEAAASLFKWHADEPGTRVIALSVREQALTWYVRAIVQIGDKTTDDFAKPSGHPIEILLEKNPATTPFGQDMSFRVLYQGKPLAGQLVHVGYDGYHEHSESGEHLDSLPLRTDAEGRATFNLQLNTPWYITLVHDSVAASLTFDTR